MNPKIFGLMMKKLAFGVLDVDYFYNILAVFFTAT